MCARFISHLRDRASVLTAFTHPFLRPQAAAAANPRRAGHSDGRLLSPHESGRAAIRLARTYW